MRPKDLNPKTSLFVTRKPSLARLVLNEAHALLATLRSATFRRKVNSGGLALSLFASHLRPERNGHGPELAYSLPDKLRSTALDVHLANSITFLFLLRVADSSWFGVAIGVLLLLMGAIIFLLQHEDAAAASPSDAIEDLPEHQNIKQELEKKSALLATVNHALTAFLDSGDWSAASRPLLSFALKETQSEFALLVCMTTTVRASRASASKKSAPASSRNFAKRKKWKSWDI